MGAGDGVTFRVEISSLVTCAKPAKFSPLIVIELPAEAEDGDREIATFGVICFSLAETSVMICDTASTS